MRGLVCMHALRKRAAERQMAPHRKAFWPTKISNNCRNPSRPMGEEINRLLESISATAGVGPFSSPTATLLVRDGRQSLRTVPGRNDANRGHDDSVRSGTLCQDS